MQSVNTTVLVDYGGCGIARFIGQVIIIPGSFSAPGDSGSAILDANTKTPVGLLFAGSPTQTIANHLLFVYLSLNVFVDVAAPTLQEEGEEQPEGSVGKPNLQSLMDIQAEEEDAIFRAPGVLGMGIGLVENGRDPAFIVYSKNPRQTRRRIPRRLRGVLVRVVQSDEFRAY